MYCTENSSIKSLIKLNGSIKLELRILQFKYLCTCRHLQYLHSASRYPTRNLYVTSLYVLHIQRLKVHLKIKYGVRACVLQKRHLLHPKCKWDNTLRVDTFDVLHINSFRNPKIILYVYCICQCIHNTLSLTP